MELLPGGHYRHIHTIIAPAALELLEWLVGLAPGLELGGQLEKVVSVAHYGHPATVGPYYPLGNPDAYDHAYRIQNTGL